jgi:hypothetical protein
VGLRISFNMKKSLDELEIFTPWLRIPSDKFEQSFVKRAQLDQLLKYLSVLDHLIVVHLLEGGYLERSLGILIAKKLLCDCIIQSGRLGP